MPMTFDKRYFLRLFLTLTWTNVKMRYYGSILGYVWSLLKPLAMFGVLYLVLTVVMEQNAPHYKLFLLLGIIIWDFFVQRTNAGMNGFIGNYQMIRKIYLPRIVLVMAAVFGASSDFSSISLFFDFRSS
jgi:ABC-type polysaccharide/polyol phosphate export permease